MSLSQPVSESAKFPAKVSIHVIFIDVECILPSAGKLSDYNPDTESGQVNGLEGSAYDNLQILNTYMKIANFPGWGLICTDKKYAKSHCFPTGPLQYASCVEVYVEYIYALSGELLGWRFFFAACDPAFSFDRALTELFDVETSRRAKIKLSQNPMPTKQRERKRFSLPTSQRVWVREFLSPYLCDRFDDNPTTVKALNTATSHALSAPENPAKTSVCLSLEWTNEVLLRRFGDRIDQDYRNTSKYYATTNANVAVQENDFLDAEPMMVATNVVTKLAFPFKAYPIQHSCLDPKVIMEMNIRDPPELVDRALEMKFGPQEELSAEERERNRMHMERDINRRMRTEITRLAEVDPNNKLPVNPAVEPVRKRFKYDLDQLKTAEERHAYRGSMMASVARNAVIYNNELNPAGRSSLNWYNEKIKGDIRWGTARKRMNKMDTTLTDFGRVVT